MPVAAPPRPVDSSSCDVVHAATVAAEPLGAGVGATLGVTELLAAGVGVVPGDDEVDIDDDGDVASGLGGDDFELLEPPLHPLTVITEHSAQNRTSRRTTRA